MISIFTLPLAANEAREVAISGEYFELRNAVYPITLIELLDRSGGVVSRMDNPEQSDFVRPGRYETVRITNGPNAQTVKHFYGSGDAGSRRTSGIVEVVDGAKSRTLAGLVFLGYGYCPAVSAKFSYVQLWNPAASGRRLVLGQVTYAANQAASAIAHMGYMTVALASLSGNPKNKLLGGAVSAAEIRTENFTSAPGSVSMSDLYMPGAVNQTLKINEPIIINPGIGLIVELNALPNVGLSTNFEFYEETI